MPRAKSKLHRMPSDHPDPAMAILVHGHIYGLVGVMASAAPFGRSRYEPPPTSCHGRHYRMVSCSEPSSFCATPVPNVAPSRLSTRPSHATSLGDASFNLNCLICSGTIVKSAS